MSDQILDVPEFMERVQDDKELLLELLDIFVEDFEQKRVTLGEAITNKDFEVIGSIGHSVKGASGNISAKQLREVCIVMEEKGKSQDASGLEDLLSQMDKEYAILKERIVEVKKEL